MNVAAHTQERWIGPDLVRIEGDVLAIYSRRDMPDWAVREFCQPAIWFQDQKFFLCAKQFISRSHCWRYALSRWPEQERPSAPYSIYYSERYVSERERACEVARAFTVGGCFLMPLYPLLGFLWSGAKDRLVPCGFEPRSMTSFSVGVQFLAFIIFGIFIGYLGYWSIRNVLLLAVLGLDIIMRYDSLLRGHERELGFMEWCFRR